LNWVHYFIYYTPHFTPPLALTYNRRGTDQRIMCEGQDIEKKQTEKNLDKRISIGDFFRPIPWDLREKSPEAIQKAFHWLPSHFREGPWKPAVTIIILFVVFLTFYLTIDANIKYYASNDNNEIMKQFTGDEPYHAFTAAWYYNTATFLWMVYVGWNIYKGSNSSWGAWVSFTMWSWTIMCIRHLFCSLAPAFPSLRLWIGILRFPVLLSSSVTFGIWNFVLMPVIAMGLLKDKHRAKFLQFAFKWTMCQIHIFNVLFACCNAYLAEPSVHGLHLGDVNAGMAYMMAYILFYYCILDRIGVQLYPIFSPRTYICIPSILVAAAICVGNYFFWNRVLSAR